ncbi:MAG: hypothetical protein L3J71_02480 [Victivallaceae bacterium]|nr:hypothetical protein [Victivallaceae bacterium]
MSVFTRFNNHRENRIAAIMNKIPSPAFETVWTTTVAAETITLPLVSGYTYNATVDWGDGSTSTITAFDDVDITHAYASAGDHTVKITGILPAWSFNDLGDKLKIKSVSFGSGVIFTYLFGGFRGCANLTTINGQIAGSAITDLSYCFGWNSSLASIPVGLFDNNTAVTNMDHCFGDCSSLASIPAGLFDNNTAITKFATCFVACGSLASIPAGLFDNNTAVTDFSYCFGWSGSLASIPAGLFDNNNQVTTFVSCFNGCTALTGASGALWLNPSGASNYTLVSPDYDVGVPNGSACYAGCTGLSDYGTIPTYWK